MEERPQHVYLVLVLAVVPQVQGEQWQACHMEQSGLCIDLLLLSGNKASSGMKKLLMA